MKWLETTKKIRRWQRKQDRQCCTNNPDGYDDKGRTIPGKHPAKKKRHQRETETELRKLYRREVAHRKTLHGQLANQVIAMGTHNKAEKLSYKAFQKIFGRSIGVSSCTVRYPTVNAILVRGVSPQNRDHYKMGTTTGWGTPNRVDAFNHVFLSVGSWVPHRKKISTTLRPSIHWVS